tara:strand:- start:1673 stop:2167 length:495 start_codon:yes stop_codon:yes gene_type:complete
MIKKINILILTMFGIGYSKYAPGTVASFVTSLIFIFLYSFQINILFLILIITGVFIYSTYAIDNLKNYFNETDATEIVIDEFIGQAIPILTIYSFVAKNDFNNFILYTLLSFVLFRLFDITKPYPINKIDREIKNGFGVMFDDVVAGVYSAIIILIIISITIYE